MGGEGNKMMVFYAYKLQKKIFDFPSLETRCAFLLVILVKGSSSFWHNAVKRYIEHMLSRGCQHTHEMFSTFKSLRFQDGSGSETETISV